MSVYKIQERLVETRKTKPAPTNPDYDWSCCGEGPVLHVCGFGPTEVDAVTNYLSRLDDF